MMSLLFGDAEVSDCAYPGIYWNKTVDPVACNDVYTFNIPWVLALTVRPPSYFPLLPLF